ncbi:MAG: hypothetical protein QOF36_1547 [Microbacteriaceae bacterium]|jgi:uncharacterized protein YndB with AHSA1/START domain|nr:hypothetical protein [Microbacteriaceae bacterium]
MTMTENQPSVVDSGEFTVRRTISIAASIDKVWAAITEAQHIARWFGQSAVLDDVAVGAGGVFSFEGYGDFPVLIEELDPPRMIAYRWSNDDARGVSPDHVDPDHSTVFRFTLEPVASGTQLTVVETGFGTTSDPAFNMESHRGGWDAGLDELVAYLEGRP